MWGEIAQAKSENKREIKLSGAEISERIDKDGIDSSLFALESLNLLNISDTTLKQLPSEISNLIHLQTLLLYGNEIATIPDTISRLEKLKVLDVSRNKLQSVPDTITQLNNLSTINLSNNQLTTFPVLKSFTKLLMIDLSSNLLTEFPHIYSAENSNLSEIYLKENSIGGIPHEISQLVSLKHFSLSKNKVKVIPKSLATISKLKGTNGICWLFDKFVFLIFFLYVYDTSNWILPLVPLKIDLDLSENPVSDKRLLKLIQQCRTKQVLDYVKQHGEDAPKSDGNEKSTQNQKSSKSKKSKKSESSDTEPAQQINVKRHGADTVKVFHNVYA